jgi:hypothetical protein
MCLPDGDWPDNRHCQARLIVKLNETLYGVKQPNRVYIEEVFDFIVDYLGLLAAVAASGLFFGGTLGKPNGVLIVELIGSTDITMPRTMM